MGPLTALAEKILADAKRIDAFQASQGKPPTSVDYDTLGDLPPDLDDVRNALADTTQALHQLAARPQTSFLEILFSVSDLAVIANKSRLFFALVENVIDPKPELLLIVVRLFNCST